MHNPVTLLPRLFQFLPRKAKSGVRDGSVLFLVTVGLTVGLALKTRAESPETAPPQLKQTLTQIDAAANRRNVEGVMQFYAANFKNSDGLTRDSMTQALRQLWERYPQLTYRTELKSWQNQGNGIVAETVTTITGAQTSDGKQMKLESTLRSRQRLENQKIVQQDILAERTMLVSGANPPNVQVSLPEQVGVGQPFNFDVIVKEPIGDNLLLGTALEEPIQPQRYLDAAKLDLEILSAGGIYKVGKAPAQPEDRWISAVLIRGDGMTMITQRLRVVSNPSASSAAPSK